MDSGFGLIDGLRYFSCPRKSFPTFFYEIRINQRLRKNDKCSLIKNFYERRLRTTITNDDYERRLRRFLTITTIFNDYDDF